MPKFKNKDVNEKAIVYIAALPTWLGSISQVCIGTKIKPIKALPIGSKEKPANLFIKVLEVSDTSHHLFFN